MISQKLIAVLSDTASNEPSAFYSRNERKCTIRTHNKHVLDVFLLFIDYGKHSHSSCWYSQTFAQKRKIILKYSPNDQQTVEKHRFLIVLQFLNSNQRFGGLKWYWNTPTKTWSVKNLGKSSKEIKDILGSGWLQGGGGSASSKQANVKNLTHF